MKHFLLSLTLLLPMLCFAQLSDSTFNPRALSVKAISKIEKNITSINEKVENKTDKTLQHLQKQEAKLQNILSRKDSIAAKELFAVNNRYKKFSEKIKAVSAPKALTEYIPV